MPPLWTRDLAFRTTPNEKIPKTSCRSHSCHYAGLRFSTWLWHHVPHYTSNDDVGNSLGHICTRYWLHVLTCALKYLEKRTHMILLPGLQRRKICTLQPWGDRHPRSGTAARVTFIKVEETSELIHRVLSNNATQELLRYCGQVNVQSLRWHMSP